MSRGFSSSIDSQTRHASVISLENGDSDKYMYNVYADMVWQNLGIFLIYGWLYFLICIVYIIINVVKYFGVQFAYTE